MKTAICDTDAFYPFRDLVEGRFRNLADLKAIERFVRTVVLHDETTVQITPLSYNEDAEAEADYAHQSSGQGHQKMVIVGIGPVLTKYDFVTQRDIPQPAASFALSPAIMENIAFFSNATEGNAFFKAHTEFAKKALAVVQSGNGSALLCSEFGQKIISSAEKYPEKLFASLDEDLQKFSKEINVNRLGFRVPPVLAIVLSRCARRDAIPIVLKDLRDEWAEARKKVWKLIDNLRKCETSKEAYEIQRELSEASLLFSPFHKELASHPGRMLWEIVGTASAGGIAAQLAGGNPIIGALTSTAIQLPKTASQSFREFRKAFFGIGAFDLANKVRREVSSVEIDALKRLLRPDEFAALH